jgi:hypothetical protein
LPDETTFEDLIEKIRERTERRGQLDNDRRDGGLPISIDTIGDLTGVWMTTGVIDHGSTATVYLTRNREAGGDSLFRKAPLSIQVWEDGTGTGGGMERASGPIGPSASFSLIDRNNFYVEVEWAPSNEIYSVTVTNNTGASCDFAVNALGF